MFLTWLDLLPQMQAFEHRFPRGREPAVHLRVTRNNFGSLSNDVGKEKS